MSPSGRHWLLSAQLGLKVWSSPFCRHCLPLSCLLSPPSGLCPPGTTLTPAALPRGLNHRRAFVTSGPVGLALGLLQVLPCVSSSLSFPGGFSQALSFPLPPIIFSSRPASSPTLVLYLPPLQATPFSPGSTQCPGSRKLDTGRFSKLVALALGAVLELPISLLYFFNLFLNVKPCEPTRST